MYKFHLPVTECQSSASRPCVHATAQGRALPAVSLSMQCQSEISSVSRTSIMMGVMGVRKNALFLRKVEYLS